MLTDSAEAAPGSQPTQVRQREEGSTLQSRLCESHTVVAFCLRVLLGSGGVSRVLPGEWRGVKDQEEEALAAEASETRSNQADILQPLKKAALEGGKVPHLTHQGVSHPLPTAQLCSPDVCFRSASSLQGLNGKGWWSLWRKTWNLWHLRISCLDCLQNCRRKCRPRNTHPTGKSTRPSWH